MHPTTISLIDSALGNSDGEGRIMWHGVGVPLDVLVRAVRLEDRYPQNYKHGYLVQWAERERQKRINLVQSNDLSLDTPQK